MDAVPEYDPERVYVSDMKKALAWYNLLLEKNLMDFSEEEKQEEGGSEEKPAAEPEKTENSQSAGGENLMKKVEDFIVLNHKWLNYKTFGIDEPLNHKARFRTIQENSFPTILQIQGADWPGIFLPDGNSVALQPTLQGSNHQEIIAFQQ